MFYKLVLDDSLFILHEKFRSGIPIEKLDSKTLFALLNIIKLPYYSFPSQIIRCKNSLPESYIKEIAPAILANGCSENSLEDAAMRTQLRIILTDDNQKPFPYVSIFSPSCAMDFNIRIKNGVSRTALHDYIKLCAKGAKRFGITDRYLDNALQNPACQIHKLFSDPDTEIDCYEDISQTSCETSNSLRQFLKDQRCRNKVKTKRTNFQSIHDRYLLLDHGNYKMEILLSSGIEYLFNTDKEITCIFRIIE